MTLHPVPNDQTAEAPSSTLLRQGHDFDSEFQFFELSETIAQLKSEKPIHSGSRNAVTLAKSSTINVVLILLQPGSTLPEHHANAAISLMVHSGAIDLTVSRKTTSLRAGTFAALGEGVLHSLVAREESVLLLTVGAR